MAGDEVPDILHLPRYAAASATRRNAHGRPAGAFGAV